GPQLVVDDGGDATLLIHKGHELEEGSDWAKTKSANKEEQVIKGLLLEIHRENPYRWHEIVKDWRGLSEETTTGVHRLYKLHQEKRRSEEHTSELQSPDHLVCRLLLGKKKRT